VVSVRPYNEIEADWERLALALDAPPFLRPGWIRAWDDAFGSGNGEALTRMEDGELVGVAPVMTARRRVHSPTNWHTPQFGVLSADPATRRVLGRALLERVSQRLELRFLERDDLLISVLRGDARKRGMATHQRVIARSPYVPIRGTWAEYEAGLSKNLRKNLRRRRRQLETRGDVSVTMHTGGAGLEGQLESAFAIEASGWKGERGTAIQSQSHTRAFYSRIAQWAAQTGELRLAFLRVDGEPIAFDLALESGAVHYSLKSSYDEAYRWFGPGAELTRALIERAFQLDLDRFDLLGGVDDFKRAWAGDHAREMVVFQAFAPGALGAVDRIVQCHGPEIATRARSQFARTRAAATSVAAATSGPWLEGAPLALSLA
jgi:CelD/BcsL family acetyltransferase involved in cellulose biosynthesis